MTKLIPLDAAIAAITIGHTVTQHEKALRAIPAIDPAAIREAALAEAALPEAIRLMKLAQATMRACGWHLAVASDAKSDDGLLEAASTEIEADFADFLAAHGGAA